MEEPVKGTVTPLSSLFPAEEAHKASKRVQETISERQKELEQLQHFIADNTSIINLVQKLPDELHHDIMVPFGKAAFFPGRLIHTNEFLVLLGEGYHVERTSKQTVDILKRRGKALESQVESFKAVMRDLKAEASFFEATAAEVAEGLVDIREEYIDGTSSEKVFEADSMKPVIKDEEFANMMSKIDEFEEEELAAESGDEYDEDDEENEENARFMSRTDKHEETELPAEIVSERDEDEHIKPDFGHYGSQYSFDQKHKSSEGHRINSPPKQSKVEHPISKELPSKPTFRQELHNQLEDLKVQSSLAASSRKTGVSGGDRSTTLTRPSSAQKASVFPQVKETIQAKPQSRNTAFTGSIVEHTHNLETNPRGQTTATPEPTTTQTSKPVSRFKLQRR